MRGDKWSTIKLEIFEVILAIVLGLAGYCIEQHFPTENATDEIEYRECELAKVYSNTPIISKLTNEEKIIKMNFDERAEAFMDGRIAADMSTQFSNSEFYCDYEAEDDYHGTLSEMLTKYATAYIHDRDNVEPFDITTQKLKSKNTDFLLVNIFHNSTVDDITIHVLLRNTADSLEVAYVNYDGSRSDDNYLDGIVVLSAGSGGATCHSSDGIYINDEGTITELYYSEDQDCWGFSHSAEYQYNMECNLIDKLEQIDINQEFLDNTFIEQMEVNQKVYYQIYNEAYETSPDIYQADYDAVVKAFQTSNIADTGILCSFDEDLFRYARDYAATFGLTLE